MSIRITKGNLLDNAVLGEYDAIMHGVNCNPSQADSGIARQVWQRFPKVLKDLREWVENTPMLGTFSNLGTTYDLMVNNESRMEMFMEQPTMVTRPLGKPFAIINAFTQYHGGADFYLSSLEVILQDINTGYSGKIIGIPKIGCGIGGGNWEQVELLLLTHAPDVHWEVVVYV